MDRDARRPVDVGDSAAAAEEAMEGDRSPSPAAEEAVDDDGSSSTAAAEAMDDDGSSSPASYIRLVQHLIEKCICYNMNKQECVQTLEKHANIQPVITSTVWKELEKENREFFDEYKKDRPGEESTQKDPSQEQTSAPKSSDVVDDEDEDEQPSAPKSSDVVDEDDEEQPFRSQELGSDDDNDDEQPSPHKSSEDDDDGD